MEQPYIGVTGISSAREALGITAIFEQALPAAAHCTHRGMVGFLVSDAILKGRVSAPAKYPPTDALVGLLTASAGSGLNTIHYHTTERSTLADQVASLLNQDRIYERELCRAVQLNMAWPDVSEVRALRAGFPDLSVILQLGARVLHRYDHSDIADRLRTYRDLASFVLIDPSGGRGRAFAASFVVPFVSMVQEALPEATLVLAGGFTGENVLGRLEELRLSIGTKHFAIDAEGGLRGTTEADPNGPFSIQRAKDYVEKAARFFATAG